MRSLARRYRYAHVAWCYDELAAAWSFGSIPRAKRAVARALVPGERALFAGAGRGSDALTAALRGVRVCALDAEPAMLRRFERARSHSGLDPHQAHGLLGDWFEYTPSEPYDAVVASFVLNVFAADELGRALDAVASWLRPNGQLWLVDFAPPGGRALARAAAQLHYWPVALVAAALGLCALHPIRDYAPMLAGRGFDLKEERSFGPYRVWLARCPAAARAGRSTAIQVAAPSARHAPDAS